MFSWANTVHSNRLRPVGSKKSLCWVYGETEVFDCSSKVPGRGFLRVLMGVSADEDHSSIYVVI